MKKIGILIFGLLILTSCAEEKDTVNKNFDPFQNNDEIKSQFFDLDTIGLKEVVGKKGRRAVEDRYHVGAMALDFEKIFWKVVPK